LCLDSEGPATVQESVTVIEIRPFKADDLLTAFLSLEGDAIAPKGANGKGT